MYIPIPYKKRYSMLIVGRLELRQIDKRLHFSQNFGKELPKLRRKRAKVVFFGKNFA